MENRTILENVLKHQATDRVPWVPFAGVHAGKLKGHNAQEVLTDGDKLFESLMEVNRLYKPQGMPVVFDLQVEAEILGCELVWGVEAPPSVKTHPLEDEAVVPCDCTIPTENDGRIPMIVDVMKRVKAEIGNEVMLYGLICGPFTLAAHLRGNDIFMDMYDDDEYVHNLLGFCLRVAEKMAQIYIDAGMDIIAVVDPLISQISQDHFEEFMSGPFKELFDIIRAKGAYSSFFVCGDATRNIEPMCQTGPDSISIDENVNLMAAKEITDRYNIAIGGNIPLTTTMLHGTQQDNMKFVVDTLDAMPDKKNFILAPGCDMPYAVPIENTIAVGMAIADPDQARQMLENYTVVEEDIEVELPDYENLSKPLVEVFTLDSATCAACTYMMGAADEAKAYFGDKIDMVEYKYTIKENIARCKKMGVMNLPSMYINGELKFRSIVPSKEELNKAIEEKL